jgi:hypothetical protein
MSKNRLSSGIAILILSGIVLSATNPSEDKHRDVIFERVEDNGSEAASLGLKGLERVNRFLGQGFDYRNYILFSTMHLDKDSGQPITIGFLGIVL